MLAYYEHQLSPFLVEFAPGWGLRWYGMAYLAGFLIAYWLILKWSKEGWLPLSQEKAGDFLTTAVLGTLIGGRLGYCLLYDLPNTLRDPISIVAFWRQGGISGMASHGGILGLILAGVIFALRNKTDPLRLWDALALASPPGIFLGRVANFINGELWGRSTTVPWAVLFPASPEPIIPRHPSQLYAAILEGLLLGLILWFTKVKCARPGAVFAMLLTTYPVVRIIGEFFREADEQIGYLAFGLSQGQWLSIYMLGAAGCYWIWFSLKRNQG